MSKVVLGRRNPPRLEKKRKTRVEKKRKKENKRKKQALAEYEYKEQEKKRKEEEQRRLRYNEYEASYWRRVNESDGFDVDGLRLPSREAMKVFKCQKPDHCPLIIRLYAKIGLHRYNMIKGTNLQLRCVERYNRNGMMGFRPSSYYITLVAEDPATGYLVPFQTSSHEKTEHNMYVGFYVARPQNTGTVGMLWADKTAPKFYDISVPKWPSEDDKKQFYMVQESELKENYWIRLYLELGFVTTNREIRNPKLSDLKIVEVMVETVQHLKGFRDATVYIKYHQELGEGKVCKRRAIIKRSVDLRTERMCLKGDYSLESSLFISRVI